MREPKYHLVVDFTFIYYKYKFTLASGRLKLLDTYENTMMYYCLAEIEKIRQQLINASGSTSEDMMVSICFDSPSMRKDVSTEAGSKYKSNRESKLTDLDYEIIGKIKEVIEEVGYNSYKVDGFEADDLVYTAVRNAKRKYENILTVVVTIDKDMLSIIDDTVTVYRYKTSYGYTLVGKLNYEQYCTEQFRCYIPYNAIRYYLSIVGDKSDNIVGVKGLGEAAYAKIIRQVELNAGKAIWLNSSRKVAEQLICDELNQSKHVEQFKESLAMVEPIYYEEMPDIAKRDSYEGREKAYGKFGYQSLIK